ncbi:MAG: DUF1554 domain-containing protein [Anaerolineales bacterium]
MSSPQIKLETVSVPDNNPPFDPMGTLVSFFEQDTATPDNQIPGLQSTLVSLIQTAQSGTPVSQSISVTPIQLSTQTQIPSATVSAIPTGTPSIVPTQTFQLVYQQLPRPANPAPADTDTPLPTFTSPPTATATFTSIPTRTFTPVPVNLTLYFGATSNGNIGPRASADALCSANLPLGYTNYHAFISYSAADSIANMPSNYGIQTTLPIRSVTSTVIATNWADLMDASIPVALNTAGVSPTFNWWSGVQAADGTHIDGVTTNCNGWTSNSASVGGIEGYNNQVDFSWMNAFNAGCANVVAVLCIAY